MEVMYKTGNWHSSTTKTGHSNRQIFKPVFSNMNSRLSVYKVVYKNENVPIMMWLITAKLFPARWWQNIILLQVVCLTYTLHQLHMWSYLVKMCTICFAIFLHECCKETKHSYQFCFKLSNAASETCDIL